MCWCVFMFRASPTDYFGSLFVLYCSLSPSFCAKRTYSITLSLLVSLHLSAEALGLSVLNLYIAVYCYGQNEWVPITPLTPDKKIKCYCVGNKQLKRRFALKDKKTKKNLQRTSWCRSDRVDPTDNHWCGPRAFLYSCLAGVRAPTPPAPTRLPYGHTSNINHWCHTIAVMFQVNRHG